MRLSEWMEKRDPAVLRAMHERLCEAGDSVGSYPDRLIEEDFGSSRQL
jgi:hypothetical protein